MVNEDQAGDRAERLAVAVKMYGLVLRSVREEDGREVEVTGSDQMDGCRHVAREEVPLVTEDEMAVWRRGDQEDAPIAAACLNVEFELRELEWTALGLLDLALHAPDAPQPSAEPFRPAAPCSSEARWSVVSRVACG
jgi:hypothetical protein